MDAVLEEKVVGEPKVDIKPEWDKERQRADQADANFRKSEARLGAADLKTQQLERTVSELQGQMKQIEAVKGLDLATLDPNEADVPEVVREYAKMSKALEGAIGKITALEQKATQYENDADNNRQEREKEGVIERICKPLDNKYGVSLRNEARRLAEEEVEVRGFAPKDALECRDMLEKHYIALSEVASKKKEAVPSDSGRGGSKASFGDNIAPGKISDVMKQIRKGGLESLKPK